MKKKNRGHDQNKFHSFTVLSVNSIDDGSTDGSRSNKRRMRSLLQHHKGSTISSYCVYGESATETHATYYCHSICYIPIILTGCIPSH